MNLLKTKIDTVSSQGTLSFEDQTGCLIHDSSYPPILHRHEYGPKFSEGINMDRGGLGKREDGSLFACLFDGTGGGGLESLYAAQDFTEKMLELLSEKSVTDVTKLLTECSFAKPSTNYGDATCVFVDLSKNSLQGGALGDSGIIHIRKETLKASIFETILKDDRRNISDTGGCIGRFGMIYRPDNICALSREIASGDFVVLASDGLIDNLYRGEEDEILSLIISSPFFDEAGHVLQNDLPTAQELGEMIATSDNTPTALQIANRLNQYIKFVTARKRKAFETLLEEWEIVESMLAKEQIGRKFKETERNLPGKCDDCLLIVLQCP